MRRIFIILALIASNAFAQNGFKSANVFRHAAPDSGLTTRNILIDGRLTVNDAAKFNGSFTVSFSAGELWIISSDGDSFKVNMSTALYPLDIEINNTRIFAVDSTGRALTAGLSQDGDVADAGFFRLQNAAVIGWEASPAGTDITLTVDASEVMQSSGTFNAATLTEGGNAVPNSTDNLSFFSSTTSAQIAGVISDETGSGVLVFGTAPAFTTSITTPVLNSSAGDPADAGVIRLGNAELIAWEASPTGTDISLSVDASEVMQSSGAFNAVTLTESSNAVPNATDHLGFFAATTSAQLAGVLSDETGSGVAVFGTSPTITTSLAQDGDVADAGYLLLQNAAIIGWEASPAGSDVTLTVDASEIMQASGTFNAATLTEGANGVPNSTDNLSFFSATTSAQLAGVISDETGSGALVFGTSPAFTTNISQAGGDPADAGFIRLDNAAQIAWEASPTGTDVTLSVDASEIMQASGTFNATALTEGSSAVPNATDHLGFFSATTSAQIAGVVSDETGSGALVFGTAPIFTTSITSPVLLSTNGDPADAGVIRLGNAETIAWEASPAGTDITLSVDASEILQASGAFNATALTESSNGVPNSTDHLGFFASTTSAQLAGVISDETGSGVLVFGTAPVFTTSITTPTVISAAGDPADAGVIRLGNTESIAWEIAPAGTDVTVSVDASEIMTFSSASGYSFDAKLTGTSIQESAQTKALSAGVATAVIQIAVASGSFVGGIVQYTVNADDATDFQARTGQVFFQAVNKAGTETAVVSGVINGDANPAETQDGSAIAQSSASTLTYTWGVDTTPTNAFNLTLNAASGLTETTLNIRYRIIITSGTATVTPQ